MSIFNPTQTTTIIPKRMIGSFTAFLTIEETASDDLEITQHPVQQGATITDHAYMKPASLQVRIMFDSSTGTLPEIYEKLRKLQSQAIPFDVVTGKRAYKNMLLKSLGQTTDAQTENVLSISCEFQEIFIVQIETTSVPARAVQRRPGTTGATENAGQKAATPAPEKQRSALNTLFGG